MGVNFYGCEFLWPQPECRRKKLIAALKRIQSALGKLNDIQVHGRLAHRFVRPRPGVAMQTQKAFAIGLLTGREHAEAATQGAVVRGCPRCRQNVPRRFRGGPLSGIEHHSCQRRRRVGGITDSE